MTKFILSTMMIAMAGVAAAGSTYKIDLSSSVWVGTNQLKAGAYKIEMSGDKAIIRSGKDSVEVPAKLESGSQKYANTSLDVSRDGDKAMLREIRIGGTTNTIVLSPAK